MLSRVLLHSKTPTAPSNIGRVFSNLIYTQRVNLPNGVYFAMLGSVAAGLYLGNKFAVKVLCKVNPPNPPRFYEEPPIRHPHTPDED
jgi:hypothetical protein